MRGKASLTVEKESAAKRSVDNAGRRARQGARCGATLGRLGQKVVLLLLGTRSLAAVETPEGCGQLKRMIR